MNAQSYLRYVTLALFFLFSTLFQVKTPVIQNYSPARKSGNRFLLHCAAELPAPVSALIRELKSSYAPFYRDRSKKKLIQMGRSVVPYLMASMKESEEPEVSLALLEIIEEIGDPACAGDLLNILERSESVDIVCQCIKTLGTLKSPLAIPKLMSTLKEAPEMHFFEQDVSKVISVTLWAMGEIEDSQFVKPIILFARDYPQSQYLSQCATALGKIGDYRSQPFLIDLMKHRDADVRLSAVQALTPFVNSSMLKFLWTAFENEPNPDVKLGLIELIAKVSEPRDIQKFLGMLKSGTDYAVQQMSERALKLQGEKTIPFIIAELEQSTDDEQKINCIKVLSDLCTPDALSQVAKMTNEKNVLVQIAAIEALGKCGDESSNEVLAKLAFSFKKAVREAARAAKNKIFLRTEQNKAKSREP